MSPERQFESLHNHTVISDGQLTHTELLHAAENAGFGLISFTDHDILPRDKDLESLKDYDGPVDWNVGIEISSGLPHELGGGPATLFHILGLRIDHTNQSLRSYCDDAATARLDRLERTVRNLQSVGFNIDLDECLKNAGEGAPATPHISRALLRDTDNMRRLEAIAEDMKQKSVNDPELAKKYQTMMLKVKTGQRHPYVRDLLFGDSAYVPDVYVPYEFSLEMDKTVKLIRAAGGLAIIAHWPSIREVITESHVTKVAAEQRIDGLELRTIYNANPTIETDIAFLKDVATEHNLLTTVGVDAHEPDDFTKFTEIPGAAEMSVGQWSRISP
jgi:hypothetical protein